MDAEGYKYMVNTEKLEEFYDDLLEDWIPHVISMRLSPEVFLNLDLKLKIKNYVQKEL